MGKNNDLEQMILQELVLQPILEFIVDKFAEELLKEDEEDNGGFSNVDNLANQGQNAQFASSVETSIVLPESENPLLTGRISNTNYIWHTNPNACEKCQDLDNTVYINKSDVPNKPHPNCKCEIEELEEQEDRCNCLDDLFEQIENIISSAENLLLDVNNYIQYFSNLTNTKIKNSIAKRILDNCIEGLQQIAGTINDFIKNYSDMKEANTIGADKYFHSKANCDASKRGELGAIMAKAISDFREFTDLFKNVLIKGMTVAESLKDSKEDQEANKYGREQGKKFPNQNSRDSVKNYRPNGLPEQY